MTDRHAIVDSLLTERTVDIVTTGRRSGQPRTTEIWITVIDGEPLICGSPNAGRADVEHQPRDWMANLRAKPALVIRLKAGVAADLPATATPVTDRDERHRILSAPPTAYYREALTFDAALDHSPIVRITFIGDAAWLNDTLAASGASSAVAGG
ncbi:MAG: nitroreductase/quinone reductase family protein [Acidimicrobiales bacterium]